MTMHKYIYWSNLLPNEKGEVSANVHILIGYKQASITNFQKMAAELRKTFPQASDDEICGGKIYNSSRVFGFTIVDWNSYIPKKEYPGWCQIDNGQIEYDW